MSRKKAPRLPDSTPENLDDQPKNTVRLTAADTADAIRAKTALAALKSLRAQDKAAGRPANPVLDELFLDEALRDDEDGDF